MAHIRNRNVEATYVPRARLDNVKTRESLHGVGLYVLVGGMDEHAKPQVYIGEAECVFDRLMQHNAKKDFWDYAITLTSNNKHLTKTHVRFLEWLCHDKASKANRCILHNATIPTKSHVQESTEADLYDNFETIGLLLSVLGLNVSQSLAVESAQRSADQSDVSSIKSGDSSKNCELEHESHIPRLDPIFKIAAHNIQAFGQYTQLGFLVFAGAHCAKKVLPSYERSTRTKLINDGMLLDKGDFYELKEHYVFRSPSAASALVLGRSSNGWTEWKTVDGRTLHQLYRKQHEPACS